VNPLQLRLFLASFLGLYFELVIIRYLSTEIRVFAYLMNLPLIASFVGLGLGMILGKPPRLLNRLFPLIASVLFLLIGFSDQLNLTHLPFPNTDYILWGTYDTAGIPPLLLLFDYLFVTLFVLALVVAFFILLGGLIGGELSQSPPLSGYATNLVGSLAGVLTFTLLSYLGSLPVIWIGLGMCAAVPFISRLALIVTFAAALLTTTVSQHQALWSPYYRIDLEALPAPAGLSRPSGYMLSVNHDYHQKALDLSPSFVASHPGAEPNRSALPTYELPYRLVGTPDQVLIVGAGTGNDVAAALRHGVGHVDAVEIDPVIYKIGSQYHPEEPYSSPRVTVFLDDARAFLKKTTKTYDLIIFAYLDSHTLLGSGFSSVRLDNYVYTVESFTEARDRLRSGGSLVLSFAAGKTFVTDRIFASLTRAFGVAPRAYYTEFDTTGVVFLEGAARASSVAIDYPDITNDLLRNASGTTVATDQWPFLYLQGRTIPNSILWILIPFLMGCLLLIHGTIKLRGLTKRGNLHFFFLGAGFLLLETSGVTKLSLLFGSTWIVNAVVIGAFIFMAFIANAVILTRSISQRLAYLGLFVSLLLNVFFPYRLLYGLSSAEKVLAAAVIAGLPVFFSGLVFSMSFRACERPSEALGTNMLGAVVGGVFENAVMIGGTPILGFLAVAFYAASAALTTYRSSTGFP